MKITLKQLYQMQLTMKPGFVAACMRSGEHVVELKDEDFAKHQIDYKEDTPRMGFNLEEGPAIAALDMAISKGLGDDITAIARGLGVEKATKLFTKLTGVNCGCEWRRDWLNKFWPYKT